MTQPWLTVATVVRDDRPGLITTVESLLSQDVTGVEHLVVDSSSDGERVDGLLESLRPESRYAWVPPEGIYPAMNQALARATGTYVLFLNAGDSLYAPTVLTSLRAALPDSGAEWAFGPVEIVQGNGVRTITPSWDYARERARGFSRGLFPPHQGTVAMVSVLRDLGGFDPKYRIVADYAAALRLSERSTPLQLEFVVASFVEGGTSTTQWRSSIAEFHRARRELLAMGAGARLRESWDTGAQFLRLWIYRDVLKRGAA